MSQLLALEFPNWVPINVVGVCIAVWLIPCVVPLLIKSTKVALTVELLAHFIGISIIFGTLYYVVPAFKVLFEEFSSKCFFLSLLVLRTWQYALLLSIVDCWI